MEGHKWTRLKRIQIWVILKKVGPTFFKNRLVCDVTIIYFQ